jgi:hypothetical protein
LSEGADAKGQPDWANFKCQIYHDCMAKVFESIIGPSQNGMLAECADGISRQVFPYIQDLSADMEEMLVSYW